jgi:hypothetical protein
LKHTKFVFEVTWVLIIAQNTKRASAPDHQQVPTTPLLVRRHFAKESGPLHRNDTEREKGAIARAIHQPSTQHNTMHIYTYITSRKHQKTPKKY